MNSRKLAHLARSSTCRIHISSPLVHWICKCPTLRRVRGHLSPWANPWKRIFSKTNRSRVRSAADSGVLPSGHCAVYVHYSHVPRPPWCCIRDGIGKQSERRRWRTMVGVETATTTSSIVYWVRSRSGELSLVCRMQHRRRTCVVSLWCAGCCRFSCQCHYHGWIGEGSAVWRVRLKGYIARLGHILLRFLLLLLSFMT